MSTFERCWHFLFYKIFSEGEIITISVRKRGDVFETIPDNIIDVDMYCDNILGDEDMEDLNLSKEKDNFEK